jgi:hypothetical protein
VVVPSWAVTTVVIVFGPTFKKIPSDAVPDATGAPSTVTVALGSVVVGVTITELALFGTEAEYAVVLTAKAGDKVPALRLNAESVAIAEGALVMVTV